MIVTGSGQKATKPMLIDLVEVILSQVIHVTKLFLMERRSPERMESYSWLRFERKTRLKLPRSARAPERKSWL